MAYIIQPLVAQHDRGAFCCGNEIIDRFCTQQALKDHQRYRVRVFVACEEDKAAVAGFYSLCASALEARTFPGFGKRSIPALYLPMIGVCEAHAKRKLGTALMTDALQRALEVASNAGAHCLWLDAVDEQTAGFYEKLGFERITPGQLQMYIAMETIADAFSNGD